jgi:acyl carrier protein
MLIEASNTSGSHVNQFGCLIFQQPVKGDQMKAELRRVLSEAASLDVPVETLSDTDDLYAAGLSSLGTVRVMLAVEDALGIEVPGELITFELFQSIDSLACALAPLVAETSGARVQCVAARR